MNKKQIQEIESMAKAIVELPLTQVDSQARVLTNFIERFNKIDPKPDEDYLIYKNGTHWFGAYGKLTFDDAAKLLSETMGGYHYSRVEEYIKGKILITNSTGTGDSTTVEVYEIRQVEND